MKVKVLKQTNNVVFTFAAENGIVHTVLREMLSKYYSENSGAEGIAKQLREEFKNSSFKSIRDLVVLTDKDHVIIQRNIEANYTSTRIFKVEEHDIVVATVEEICVYQNTLTKQHYTKKILNKKYDYHFNAKLLLVIGETNELNNDIAYNIRLQLDRPAEEKKRALWAAHDKAQGIQTQSCKNGE